MTYWQTQHFKAMQRAWYAKLEASGFEDCEELIAGELVLSQTAAHPYKELSGVQVEAKTSYYQVMGEISETFEFSNVIDRTIVTMFASGSKIKAICEMLEARGLPSFRQRRRRCRGTVRYTIRKYEMLWGLKEYSPKQLNQKVKRSA